MKSLEDLKAIRDRVQNQRDMRNDNDNDTRIVIGMATCGIAAGARPVLNEFLQEINKRGLSGVTVTQTGCIGMCRLEPIVEIFKPGEEKVTYVKMTPDKVAKVVTEHIVNGRPVMDYTIGAAQTGGK